MVILTVFAFLAGIVTILSPCILPVLPIVLSSATSKGKSRPIGIVLGFIFSFTFFTLALSAIVRATHLSPDFLRWVAVVVVFIFGMSMVFPKTQEVLEILFSKISGLFPSVSNHTGFVGGILIGLSLGLVWSPCVGPILASIIALAATNTVTQSSIFIMLAYSIGTAIPMLGTMIYGRKLLDRVPILTKNTQRIQRIFGIVMIVTAIAIATGIDRKFQTYVIRVFPQYGAGLTGLENQQVVKQQIDSTKGPLSSQQTQNLGFLTPDYGPAPDFSSGTHWINSKPLSIKELKGKVVLVDFWTYTCINCIRTFPYTTAWYEKYRDKGFVLIGVHTPEFEFEKDTRNVENAMRDYNITYPVVQDNNFKIWNAYNNQYWPAEYFIDKNGHIRREHFGEGSYDESEKFIQKLLGEEQMSTLGLVEQQPKANTKETYIGLKRLEFFSSPEKPVKDTIATYTVPSSIPENTFALGGNWTMGSEYTTPELHAVLESRFDSQQVFLVMRLKDSKKTATVHVLLDGKPVTQFSGDDVHDSVVAVEQDRLYRLIKLDNPGQHRLRLEFPDGNVELFAFTFG